MSFMACSRVCGGAKARFRWKQLFELNIWVTLEVNIGTRVEGEALLSLSNKAALMLVEESTIFPVSNELDIFY